MRNFGSCRAPLCALALGAGAALLYLTYTPPVRAAAAHPERHVFNAGIPGATCKLSVGDQVKAVKAFRDMVPVFHHPRCSNCHGEFDIFSVKHGDGDGADVARNNNVDPTAFLTAAQRVVTFDSCNDCHSNVSGSGVRREQTDSTVVSGWMLPPPPMMWKGLDEEQLCLKVKSFERDAKEFLFHVEKDHDEQRFVDVAFRGDRALPADLMQLYKVTADPPPINFADFLALASRWVTLLDDEWNDPPECGCVMPKLELTLRSEVTATIAGTSATGDFHATVPLVADTTGVYRGTSSIKYGTFSYSMPLPPICKGNYKPGSGTVEVREVFADDRHGIKIRVAMRAEDVAGVMVITCSGGRPADFPLMPLATVWAVAHEPDRQDRDIVFEDLQIPAGAASASGRTLIARKEVSRTAPAIQGASRTKTILELWTAARN